MESDLHQVNVLGLCMPKVAHCKAATRMEQNKLPEEFLFIKITPIKNLSQKIKLLSKA